MPTFIWKGKDKSGKPVLRELTADTIEQSKTQLLAEGCTELQLRQDEIMDAVRNSLTLPSDFMGKRITVTAEELLKHQDKPPPTFGSLLSENLLSGRWFYISLLVFLPLLAYLGRTTDAAVIGLGALAILGIPIWFGLPSAIYTHILRAVDWQHWDKVISLIDRLEQIQQCHLIKFPVTDLVRLRAQALAGSGRLPAALAIFQSRENKTDLPSWLYQIYLAEIYGAAQDRVSILRCFSKAATENPTPVIYLDLANQFLRYRKDVSNGRLALAEVEKGTLVEVAKPFHLRALGILALLEGDLPAAKKNLEAALEIMERTAEQHFRDGHISVAKAYLCCVLAKLGDIEAAKKCLAQARMYLVATKENELLAECEKAVG